jgi:predicted RNase H-like nuclease
MSEQTVAGVDWAGGQWLAVVFVDRTYSNCIVAEEFQTLWNSHDLDRVVVDVPIGLPDDQKMDTYRYELDSLARAVTGFPSSVFAVPSRDAARIAYERGDLEAAASQNQADLGKGLTPPSYGILSGIGEVDALLCNDDQARDAIIEAHPEVCFRGLYGEPLSHKKQTAAGVGERLEALQEHLDNPADLLAEVAQDQTGQSGNIKIDDVLDAIALGVTAWFPTEELFFLPEEPASDSEGLPMRMAYWAANSRLSPDQQ